MRKKIKDYGKKGNGRTRIMERKEKEEQGYWKGRRKWRRGNKDNGKKDFKKWKKREGKTRIMEREEKKERGLWKGGEGRTRIMERDEKEEQG